MSSGWVSRGKEIPFFHSGSEIGQIAPLAAEIRRLDADQFCQPIAGTVDIGKNRKARSLNICKKYGLPPPLLRGGRHRRKFVVGVDLLVDNQQLSAVPQPLHVVSHRIFLIGWPLEAGEMVLLPW